MRIIFTWEGIPRRIRRMERFGVGSILHRDRARKCAAIKKLMEARPDIPQNPLFSVIVPMHKESRYILATLRSLAEQTNMSTEFILVSSGEHKGNLTMHTAQEAGFRVLHEPLPGVARARQRGLKAARGKIVVTTDADTLHHRQWLDAIRDEWKAYPELVGGFGWVYPLSASRTYQFLINVQNIFRKLQGKHLFFGTTEANEWYLREAALNVGGYDINATYAEGVVLLRKLKDYGEFRCATDIRTTVFTSDRRMIVSRMWSGVQYLLSGKEHVIEYAVVR